ncbi:RND transporter MFP subunit [Psychrosphaera saromensis]|uniref:Efflux transporter periplasmic adaptor subunit n=1 Tax=Psychrosphaera saromensis TaxID=716813 RepID=A0A2S7USQ1_9GAMM|nr:HlyD family efflux transporter periplasmic adaptor subunit [Psychrosphaera saromensis]PQJ52300.1 efflux transporter periplasmic adaptor subunit [Psychrosphaera saromensis]GHB72600.1 RND transporter MFP subunit [Psychrosphaera saromensis]GLQ13546.1 RND transporter MFP subunit [Psychrosphaera saromensis]
MINNTSGQDEVISQTISAKPWKKIMITLLITVAIIWISLPTLSQWMGGVPSVDAQTISRAKVFKGTLIRDVAVNGKLVAANAPTLYSSEAGQVTLLAKPGDLVKKDTIVATILSPELQSTVKQATATLERLKIEASRGELSDNEALLDLERSLDSAQITYNASVRELTRAELSFDKQVISELELVTRRDTKTESELLLKHAHKRVELSKKRLAFESQTRTFFVKSQQLVVDELQRRVELLNVRAPVTGVVGNWLVQKKERVTDAQSIMTIVDLSQYEAELNVPEFYADDLGLGLDVQITISGKSLLGKVISISPEVKNSQVAVRVSIADISDIQLRQNQRLNARIEFEKKDNVLMVKRGGFLASNAGKAAYVITDNNADRKPISIGSQSVEFIEIISGLNAGDEIIISSTEEFDAHPAILLN